MSELSGLLSWRSLLTAVVVYSVAPYALLWLALHLWPKDHPRRAEYDAEYDVVPIYRRPFWVGDAVVRSLLNGLPLKLTSGRLRREHITELRELILHFTFMFGVAAFAFPFVQVSELWRKWRRSRGRSAVSRDR